MGAERAPRQHYLHVTLYYLYFKKECPSESPSKGLSERKIFQRSFLVIFCGPKLKEFFTTPSQLVVFGSKAGSPSLQSDRRSRRSGRRPRSDARSPSEPRTSWRLCPRRRPMSEAWQRGGGLRRRKSGCWPSFFFFSPTAESFGVLAKLSPGALWGSHPARFWQVPRFQVRVPSKGSGRFRGSQ